MCDEARQGKSDIQRHADEEAGDETNISNLFESGIGVGNEHGI